MMIRWRPPKFSKRLVKSHRKLTRSFLKPTAKDSVAANAAPLRLLGTADSKRERRTWEHADRVHHAIQIRRRSCSAQSYRYSTESAYSMVNRSQR